MSSVTTTVVLGGIPASFMLVLTLLVLGKKVPSSMAGALQHFAAGVLLCTLLENQTFAQNGGGTGFVGKRGGWCGVLSGRCTPACPGRPLAQQRQQLNGETVNDQSATKTKHRRLEITWPAFDHDLIDALEDTNFVNNVVRMEKKIQGSMLTTGYTNT